MENLNNRQLESDSKADVAPKSAKIVSYKNAALAAILSTLASVSACSSGATASYNTGADAGGSETTADTGTKTEKDNAPVQKGSERDAYSNEHYQKELANDCSSRFRKSDEIGAIWPFGLIEGSDLITIDLCNPAGAQEVDRNKVHRKGNFLYVETNMGPYENNCYRVPNYSAAAGERAKNGTFTGATKVDQLVFTYRNGATNKVDGNRVDYAKGQLDVCPDTSATKTPAPGPVRVRTNTTPVTVNTVDTEARKKAQSAYDIAVAADKKITEATRIANEAREEAIKAMQRSRANDIPTSGR